MHKKASSPQPIRVVFGNLVDKHINLAHKFQENLEKNNDELLTNEQFQELDSLIDHTYRLLPDRELDARNPFNSIQKESKKIRFKNKETSLMTIAACSQFINKLLIGTQPKWIQDMNAAYIQQQTNKKEGINVFSRLSRDAFHKNRQNQSVDHSMCIRKRVSNPALYLRKGQGSLLTSLNSHEPIAQPPIRSSFSTTNQAKTINLLNSKQ